jgi:hypothetical protein
MQALQRARTGEGDEVFRPLLYERLDAALGETLRALKESPAHSIPLTAVALPALTHAMV